MKKDVTPIAAHAWELDSSSDWEIGNLDAFTNDFDLFNGNESSANRSEFPHSLVYRPTWNLRGECRFLSVRKWASDVKSSQCADLRRRKESGDQELRTLASTDCAEALQAFLGSLDGWQVIAAPFGRSGGKNHLASAIAEDVAKAVGCEYVPRALSSPQKATKSVVGERFTKMQVSLELPDLGPRVIVIDDVATTVSTLRGCRNSLGVRTIILLSWIYQDGVDRLVDECFDDWSW